MNHLDRKTSFTLRRVFRYGSTLLAVCGLIGLALLTFLSPRPETSNGSLPAAQRFARLALQGQAGEQEERGPLVSVEALPEPIVTLPDAFGKVDSLKDVPDVPYQPSSALERKEEPELPRLSPGDAGGPETVAQTWAGSLNMPSPIANFDGISLADQGAAFSPPDTNGDIGYDPATGRHYYFQWINLAYQAWDVTNPAAPTVVVPRTNGNALWQAAMPGTPCANTNDGDPIVLFDEQAQRWFISQFSVSTPFHQCVAVSQSANPAGAWYVYDYPYRDGVTYFNDYPHFGVWPDATYSAYFMTMHEFNPITLAYLGQSFSAFERNKLLNGDSTAALVTFALGNSYGGALPADLDGPPPVSGTPGFFFMTSPAGTLRIWEFRPDWTTPANSTVGVGAGHTANYTLASAVYTNACATCIPQPGAAQTLDSLGDRLMHRVAFRALNGGIQTVVLNHSVDADGAGGSSRTGIRWYEVRRNPSTGAWTLNQQSTYAPGSTDYRWMGSIATDRAGNIALGYSASSSTLFPAIRYTGRLFTDTVSTLPQTEMTMTVSSGAQTGSNRWGDYSMLGVDPQDGCTFWYTQEYNGASASLPWRTRIGSFKYAECTPITTGNLTGTVTNANTSAPINGATVRLMDAANNMWSATTNASGRYQFLGIPAATYTATATAIGYLPGTATGVGVSVGITTTQNFALTPLAQADLNITKTASASVVATGAPVAYTLSINNLGPDSLTTTVTVTDILPAGVTFVSANGTGWSCTGTATVICTRASQAVGAAPNIIINVTAPASLGIITNTAVIASGVADVMPGNNTSSASVTVASQTDLAISKTGPATALINSTLVYTLNVTNNGPLQIGVPITQTYTNAASITINDGAAASVYPSIINVPGIGTVVSATARLMGFTHTWPEDVDILLVAPGGQRTLLMSDPLDGPSASNLNLAFADSGPAIGCASGALTSTTYHPTNCPDDFGNDTFPGPAPAGPYTARMSDFVGAISNGAWNLYVRDDATPDNGSISGGWVLTLTGVYTGPITVTDTLPAGTTFVGASDSGWACSQALGIVTCTRSALAVGAAPSIVITTTAPASAGIITNTASVNSPLADATPGNNTASAATTIVSNAIVYAHPSDPTCGGNTPCYSGGTAIQQALSGVAVNGQVIVLSTHTTNAALLCAGNVTVSGASGATITWTGAAGDLFTAQNCDLQVKGLALNGGSTATIFHQVGTGTLTAYANNIASFAAAYSGSGTHNIGHNYWGTTDPLASAPAGFSASEWAARLGASIANWSEGTGSATLTAGANTASLSGGSGTAVIVSHGRGQANAPFGNGVAPYVNQMCSDFYDLFTVNGSGTWTAQIPVDTAANCTTNTLTPRRVAWITALAQCSPATNTTCWNAIALARVSVSGQTLLISGLSIAELGGTPFVAGDIGGADPTALSLKSLTAQNHGAPSGVLIAGMLILFGVGVSLAMRSRRLA